MATKKPKLIQYKSPVGVASWPRLTKPDTQFHADGIYSVRLRFKKDAPDTVAFLAMLEDLYEKGVEKMTAENAKPGKKLKLADKPWKDAEDDAGNPTGEVEVNFKMKAIVRPKDKTKEPWSQKPGVFDRAGKELPATVRVGGGSTMRAAFNVVPFYTKLIGAGVSIRLLGVQVVNLVEFSGKSFSGMGFDQIDGDDDESPAGADELGENVDDATEGSAEGDDKDEAF